MLSRYYDRFGLCEFLQYLFRLRRDVPSIIIMQIRIGYILLTAYRYFGIQNMFLNLSIENEPDCNTPETVKETHRFPVVMRFGTVSELVPTVPHSWGFRGEEPAEGA